MGISMVRSGIVGITIMVSVIFCHTIESFDSNQPVNSFEDHSKKINRKLFKKALKTVVLTRTLKSLLEGKADPNVQMSLDKYIVTPFHCLFIEKNLKNKKPNIEQIRLFLEHEADPNITLVCDGNKNKNINLLMKVINSTLKNKDKIALIKTLVEYNADFNKEDALVTPFYNLVRSDINSLDMIQYALEHNADPNIYTNETQTPFLRFISLEIPEKDKIKGIKLFLEHKADSYITRSDNIPIILDVIRLFSHQPCEKIAFLLAHKVLNPCLWYLTPEYPPRWNAQSDIRGSLLFELTRNKNLRNLLIYGTLDWIKDKAFLPIMTFLLCIKEIKKRLKTVVPKPLINTLIIRKYMLDFVFIKSFIQKMEKIKNKDRWTNLEGSMIKDDIALLIADYEYFFGC